MRSYTTAILAAVAIAVAAPAAHAGFLELNVSIPAPDAWTNIGPDGGGAVSVSASSDQISSYSITGSVDSDPHLNVLQDVLNDSGADWLEYIVTISPSPGFLVSNIAPAAPIFQPNYLPNMQVVGNQIIYTGTVGSPVVPAGATFETVFSFDVTASSGSFGYQILNSPIQVPEPASLTLLAMGAAGLLVRRRRS